MFPFFSDQKPALSFLLLSITIQLGLLRSTEAAPPVTQGLRHAWEATEGNYQADKDSNRVSVLVSDAGKKIRAEQPNSQLQPQRVMVGEQAVLRFDGENDVYRLTGLNEVLSSATIFVVAAPHSNQGDFRGLISANATNQRDYESGWNIDLGPGPSNRVNFINVEGKGFGGALNALATSGNHTDATNPRSIPFGELFVIRVSMDPLAKQVSTSLNGAAPATRSYVPSDLIMDEITLGARFYTNGPGNIRSGPHSTVT